MSRTLLRRARRAEARDHEERRRGPPPGIHDLTLGGRPELLSQVRHRRLGTTHRYLALLATLSFVVILGAPGAWAVPRAPAGRVVGEIAAGKKKGQSPAAPAPAAPAAPGAPAAPAAPAAPPRAAAGGLSTGDKLVVGIAVLIAAGLLVRELADF